VISGLKASYKRAAFLKGITPSLASDENAQFRVMLRARTRKATIAADMLLAEKALPYGSGARKLPLKADRKTIGSKKAFTVTLRVEAFDHAGNSAVASRTIKVK
jgi:hypothetical protein